MVSETYKKIEAKAFWYLERYSSSSKNLKDYLKKKVRDTELNHDSEIVINQIIYVKRPGHKKIALGRSGNMIKAIGKASRQELQVLLDRTVHLFLFVKVRENWMEDPDRYALWGLDPNA